MSSVEKTPVTLVDLPPCPVETTLTLISDKWKVLILRDLLLHGTMRFGELKKSIGHVSQKVLTSQLRQMEQSGLVNRKVYAEVPPFRVFSTDFFCFIFLSAQSCSSFRSFRHTFPAILGNASLGVGL